MLCRSSKARRGIRVDLRKMTRDPDVMATVMVLEALDGLSDRDAGAGVAGRISWKVAAGSALTAEGFDNSVLTDGARGLRASARRDRIFDAVRAVVEAT